MLRPFADGALRLPFVLTQRTFVSQQQDNHKRSQLFKIVVAGKFKNKNKQYETKSLHEANSPTENSKDVERSVGNTRNLGKKLLMFSAVNRCLKSTKGI